MPLVKSSFEFLTALLFAVNPVAVVTETTRAHMYFRRSGSPFSGRACDCGDATGRYAPRAFCLRLEHKARGGVRLGHNNSPRETCRPFPRCVPIPTVRARGTADTGACSLERLVHSRQMGRLLRIFPITRLDGDGPNWRPPLFRLAFPPPLLRLLNGREGESTTWPR